MKRIILVSISTLVILMTVSCNQQSKSPQTVVADASVGESKDKPKIDPQTFVTLLKECYYKLPASVMPDYMKTTEQRQTKPIEFDEEMNNWLSYMEFDEDGGYNKFDMAGYLKEDEQDIILIVQYGSGLDGYVLKSDKTLNYNVETEKFTEIERPIDPFTADELIGEIITYDGENITDRAKKYFNLKQEVHIGFDKNGLSASANLFSFWNGGAYNDTKEITELCVENSYDYYETEQPTAYRKWDGKRFVKK